MYALSMPVSLASLTWENKEIYLAWLKKCGAKRVFLCGVKEIYTRNSLVNSNPEKMQSLISYFQAQGLEVGVWVGGFGHGSALFGEGGVEKDKYTQIQGADGRKSDHAFCPEDERFATDYANAIEKIASMSPDLIMLDDDFRFNVRAGFYYMGCFCDFHYKRFCELVGETVPREKIEELAFTGEKNKYRTAYYDMVQESLLKFARRIREAVDKANPKVRLGASFTCEGVDTCGTSLIEISKAMAGNTKPFARIAGAPYWSPYIIPVVEAARLQLSWWKNAGVEIFVEGDTYPRPRYNVPSKPCELFELLLHANGEGDGILAYLFDYYQKPDYETGYLTRYLQNTELRNRLAEMFAGKKKVGVYAFGVQNKVRDYSLPTELIKRTPRRLEEMQLFSPAQELISGNSIPTAFEKGEYPVLLFGENAKYIDLADLKNGAILDIKAAQILSSRGVDTGLLSARAKAFSGEFYLRAQDEVPSVSHPDTQEIEVKEGAIVESKFTPDNTPASYRYENGAGQRFFVMAFDALSLHYGYNANYMKNYYRQAQILSAIEWLCGKKAPMSALKCPNLYFLTAKDERGTMAGAVANIYIEDIYDLEICLDKAYKQAKFIGVEGELLGDKIRVKHLPPFAFMAVELQ